MDVLYIPQLDETGSGGDGEGVGVAARYRILRRVPEDGVVNLTDRAITRIDIADGCAALKLVVPPEAKGSARDFFVRLVITAEDIPEVTFAAPTGETISFEDVDGDVFKCETGVNVFAFTELDGGIFIVNRKMVDIDQEVEFDPCGGVLNETKLSFKLGAQYGNLPSPSMPGYVFQGWFTTAEGDEGTRVSETDRCKTGVTRLYARWAVYVDPFVAAICPAGNLTFFTEGAAEWIVDGDGTARSGGIGDGQATTLKTVVQGKGTISFRWRTSSEGNFDWLRLRVDGNEITRISGSREWEDFSHVVDADSSHTVEWRYDKDGSVSEGEDCGWIDDVAWTPTEG